MLKKLLLAIAMAGSALAGAQDPEIALTPEEREYLRRIPAIKMCVDPDWTPFEHIDKQGRHVGIAADLVQRVAQRVGLRIDLYPTKTWEESVAASKVGHCHILSFLNQTPSREEWLSFTDPIFYDQNIIITREEHPYIGDIRGLKDERVALPGGTMVEERIRRDFPNLVIVTTGSESEAVSLVSERKAELTVRSLIVAAYAIKKEGLFNLKIAGQIPEYSNKLRIGVRKEEPLLRSILDKGVQTITPQDREAIANRHVSVQVYSNFDTTLLWQVGAVALVVIALVLYWNRKLQAINREFERLSITDRLTGLYNRLRLDTVLEAEVQRSSRFGQPFSVILLDIDHFKAVNDEYGHHTGDDVLIEVARILQTHTRETDVVGRWGGEEFLVVCPHTHREGARTLAENLRSKMQERDIPTVGHKTASFGVAAYEAKDHAKDVVARADTALYEAKRNGRNRVEAG
ncbi:diguanylate cyclase [Candidatus Symbiobacter mobilis]|uniref:diguanylate cyclase n=1 Tax=Candidatus Symbiobacter mobilis CR TaxID=946483 RepID=U5N934_9BURK|nr:diguanylate cyclase [Candidatus Symbiobacter mobilis]AGX87882.1 GGDEF domain protein [Candidatus Symbiobacter mobilis CR]